MKSFGATFAGCLVIAVAVFGLSFGTGRAQGGLQEPAAHVIDLELSDLEIGKAVAYLFAKVNGKYSLAPDVKGVTTVSLRQVPFESALANVLRQVNATWRIRDGVYEIVLKPQPEIDWARVAAEEKEARGEDAVEVIARLYKNAGVSVEISPDVKGRIRLNENDLKSLTFEAAIHRVLKQANATYLVEGGVYKIVPQSAGQKIVSFEFKNEDVRDALRQLFLSTDITYSIGVEVQGTVTATMKNVPFDTALANILKQVDSKFLIEGGVYQVVRNSTRLDEGSLVATGISPNQTPVMTQDDRYLYILRGDMLYKVNKVDLKTVEMRKLGE